MTSVLSASPKRFNVHVSEVFKFKFEGIEASSVDEAKAIAESMMSGIAPGISFRSIIDGNELLSEVDHVPDGLPTLIDPILDDGSVDYDAAVWIPALKA